MERKIGEIFEYNGEWYQCIEAYDKCSHCCFEVNYYTCRANTPCCSGPYRKDRKNVIFKKLKKVGGIISTKGRIFQKLTSDNNSCKECVFNVPNKGCCKNSYIEGVCDDTGFWIEIKQNKEAMKEKKPTYEELLHYYNSTAGLLAIDTNPQKVDFDWIVKNNFRLGFETLNTSNIRSIKPFDLEAAKAGKPVCTRDGRKARIISCSLRNKNFPIAAIVEDVEENVYQFEANGVCDEHDENLDLFLLPEKKEGWVNVYKDGDNNYRSTIYTNEKVALSRKGSACIATVKISWEE